MFSLTLEPPTVTCLTNIIEKMNISAPCLNTNPELQLYLLAAEMKSQPSSLFPFDSLWLITASRFTLWCAHSEYLISYLA